MADAGPGTLSTSWHQHRLQALARRAALQHGAVRRLLDDRLRVLHGADAAATAATTTMAAAVPQAMPPATATATAPAASTACLTRTSPLKALLAHITKQDVEAGEADVPCDAANATTRPRELKALRDYRSTWSRLAMEQRVNQALSRVPPNAGPLNTQRLVHEALSALRDTSPAYLHRLVTQVEALLWLERVGQGGSPGRKPGAGAATATARPTGSSRS